MPFGPPLNGKHVRLRAVEAGDAVAFQQLGRHAEIQRMFGSAHPVTGTISQAGADAWVATLGGDGCIEWVVEAERRFLGTTRLHCLREASARYAVGFFDPAQLGRGYGTEVTGLVMEYAFRELRLEQLTLAVLVFNERAIRCYRRCGFREIGRVQEAAVIDGEPFDDILMAVTADEYLGRS
jgi:ribosomal-protein-alanine N-acetyltransferase